MIGLKKIKLESKNLITRAQLEKIRLTMLMLSRNRESWNLQCSHTHLQLNHHQKRRGKHIIYQLKFFLVDTFNQIVATASVPTDYNCYIIWNRAELFSKFRKVPILLLYFLIFFLRNATQSHFLSICFLLFLSQSISDKS